MRVSWFVPDEEKQQVFDLEPDSNAGTMHTGRMISSPIFVPAHSYTELPNTIARNVSARWTCLVAIDGGQIVEMDPRKLTMRDP